MGHDRNIMTIAWPRAWREILAWTIGGIGLLTLCLIATFYTRAHWCPFQAVASMQIDLETWWPIVCLRIKPVTTIATILPESATSVFALYWGRR